MNINYKNRKYQTEFCFTSVNGASIVCQQTDLEKVEKTPLYQENDFHIYFILRRPRVTIDLNSAVLYEGILSAIFCIHDHSSKNEVEIQFSISDIIPNYMPENFYSEYPYNEIVFLNKNKGKVIVKTITILDNFVEKLSDKIAAEILYIGQSYGKNGSRKSIERLLNHSKLQQIYADNSAKRPDTEIWVLITVFDAEIAMVIVPEKTEYMVSDEEDDKHVSEILAKGINHDQQINYIEASLIKYFMPPYNETFKKNFPNPTHESYTQCYDIDLNSIIAELQTDEIGFLVYSKNTEKKYNHQASFSLYSKDERANMFDLGSLNYIDDFQFSLTRETIKKDT